MKEKIRELEERIEADKEYIYTQLLPKIKELEKENKTLRTDSELWRHNSQTILEQNDKVWKKKIEKLKKENVDVIDTMYKIEEAKDEEWKKRLDDIIPAMNDIYATDDECWTEIRKDLMKVIREILEGSEIDGVSPKSKKVRPAGASPSAKPSGKQEDIKFVELPKEAFALLMDALDIKVPYRCDACGDAVTKDNYGYIHADFKTCSNIVCITEAIRKTEKKSTLSGVKDVRKT